MNANEEWELSELYCDWYYHMENGEYDCKPRSYVWNFLNEMWCCSQCDWGLHRIYDERNTLQAWVK